MSAQAKTICVMYVLRYHIPIPLTLYPRCVIILGPRKRTLSLTTSGPKVRILPPSHPTGIPNIYLTGHTDYGSLTLLASQNVSGLQLKDNTGAWKDVPPLDGTFVVNVGDTLSFLTKGYLKSTIHRVHAPPPDQAHIRRVGVIFGCRPNDDTPVVPAPSPVLFREGLITEDELAGKVSSDRPPTTTLEYLRARVSAVHAPKSYGAENGSKCEWPVVAFDMLSLTCVPPVVAYKNLEIVANYA